MINDKSKKARRRLIGTVVSAKMAKTVVIRIERTVQHPKYGKTYMVSKKYKVHDPEGRAKVGDTIEIEETRPMSSEKRWRYFRTVTSAV
ncbi:MAG: 30S ribosomal protein S17 [Patescibacteria group bacterium]|jgi:small subunit ribosomal protein S17